MRKRTIFTFLMVTGVAAAFFITEQVKRKMIADIPTDSTYIEEPVFEPTMLYGIAVDSFDVFQGKIKLNQNLSEILAEFNVSNEAVYQLANASRDVYDVRKLKAGYPFTVVHEKDSLKTARQMIFEPDPTQYIVFNLADSIFVKRVEREVKTEEKTLYGIVESSVYDAVLGEGASPLLVNKLVDIFAWQVDFFRIQQGDEFKVVYQQEVVGDHVVGIKNVEGAYFKHFGNDYYAVQFDQGDHLDYFDEEGNSMRKAFLRAPLNYTRISSRYSLKRFHPVQKRYKAHLGTDYAAPEGTEIRTVGDGVVVEAQFSKYNGNYVKIKHNSTYTTQYLHMSRIEKGIRPGVRVRQGQTIGYVGSTGLATGPHLCFRFWKNGQQVDALREELPASDPLEKSQMDDFSHTKNVVIHKLNSIHKKDKNTVIVQIPLGQK